LKEYPNSKFQIEGHCDSDGSNELNQTLSENRAAAVEIIIEKTDKKQVLVKPPLQNKEKRTEELKFL
jgi:outer membrane protein OmpA-like peptidoglycan-associated protein